MTPYEAIARLQRETPHEQRTLCSGCAEALIDELNGMFLPVDEPHAVVLSECCLLGCTFDYGSPDQCALHSFLREDVLCP